MKNKIKISKEQYNRIFASGLIKEHRGKLKITRDQYNRLIKESHMLGNEQSPDVLEQERDALIRKFYRKTDEFSPFWAEHGLTYEDICEVLLNKGIIINKGAGYELSTKLGDPETAKQALQDELGQMLGTERDDEPAPEAEPVDVIDDVEVDEDYPAGAQFAPDADYNKPDIPSSKNETSYEVVTANDELAILKNQMTDKFFLLDLWNNDIDADGDETVIYDFLNHNETILEKNKLIEPLTPESIDDLEGIYNLNPDFIQDLAAIRQQLTQVDEISTTWSNDRDKPFGSGASPSVVDIIKGKREKELASRLPMNSKSPLSPHKDDLPPQDPNQLRLDVDEMTSTGGSSGSFTPPMGGVITRKLQEMTDTSSAGQYDAPVIKGVTRKGKYVKTPKTKAEKNTQYPVGGFVEMDDCTKLNNNKTAINGGCSQGAVDNVVKVKKSKQNISAPSLGENKQLYETIAKQTGRTPDEIKQIIESKLNKG